MVTILHEQQATTLPAGQVLDGELWLNAADTERVTGWQWKPEGLCKGEICVPVSPAQRVTLVNNDAINVSGVWRHMGHPVVADRAHTTWVLGADSADRTNQLATLAAPDFALPDLDGATDTLSAHRGKKVLLAVWASW